MLDLLAERKASGVDLGQLKRVLNENTLVYRSTTVKVTALSPSSEAVTLAMKAFASQLPEPTRPQTRVAAPSPNHASVVLWVEGPSGVSLLGADLESAGSNDQGWGAVLALGDRTPASLVKVPHHGSESGHDRRMWDRLVTVLPQAVLTPWELAGKRLPAEEDVQRICRLAPEAAIAGRATSRPGRFEPAVERTLKGAAKSRYAVGDSVGHIRARCASSDNASWRVELVCNAAALCPVA